MMFKFFAGCGLSAFILYGLLGCGAAGTPLVKDSTQIMFERLTGDSMITGDKFFLIIPVGGCGKCVDRSKAFSKAHLNDSLISFLITGEQTSNVLKFDYSEEQLKATNIKVDSVRALIRQGFTRGFVTLITYEDGKLAKSDELIPETIDEKLKDLEKKLK